MSESISNLYEQLQRFSHLQQLHSVLSRDLRASRDKVLKETQSVRKELTFFRWCMRKNLTEAYPFSNSAFSRSMDYDRLIFYRKLISYLHEHPHELGTIIVSLPEIKIKPNENSLESLYFDNEHNLAECICFDIMSLDIDALVLLLRMILLGSKSFTRLSQQLFQLFIIITCHKPINHIFRPCLERLYKIEASFAEDSKSFGKRSEIRRSLLYQSMDDVLKCIAEMLRIMPIPLRQVVCVMKHRVLNSPASLLEWLLSTIFSPLLLNPDDWYVVIGNPAHDVNISMHNIQTVVTELLKLVVKYQSNESNKDSNNDEQKSESNDDESKVVHILDLLLETHGLIITRLLKSILEETDPCITPSKVVIPTSATPDLFTWHKIFLTIDNNAISKELRELSKSVLPPNIPNRPWITISLPTFSKGSNNQGLMNLGNEDFSKQPKSKLLKEDIAKPIRMFLLSLTEAQARVIPVSLFTDIECNPPIELKMQQTILLHEVRGRIFRDNKHSEQLKQSKISSSSLNNTISNIVKEYRDEFCYQLEDALSTANILKSLNYLQTKELSLKELKQRAIFAHENLQVRDILTLSKPDIGVLKHQLQRIANDQIRTMQDPSQGSDWNRDRFVILKTYKWISKSRNALIRFLNDYGIGKVDFKNKYGGSVLNFQDKRVSSILVNAIITEIKEIFWKRCPIEDGKFHHQVSLINRKFGSFDDFYDSFLEKNLAPERPRVSSAAMNLLINEMSKINHATTVNQVEKSIQNCREMLVAAIHGADSATGDDYMPLLCYIIVKSQPQHLPSQLQTVKTISQRKVQNKYFIDACVAMKALRNFANAVFPPDPLIINNNNISTPGGGGSSSNQQSSNLNVPNNNNDNNGNSRGRDKERSKSKSSSSRSRSRSKSKSKSKSYNTNNNGTISNIGMVKQQSSSAQFFTAMKAKLPTKLNVGGSTMQKLKNLGGQFTQQLVQTNPQQQQQYHNPNQNENQNQTQNQNQYQYQQYQQQQQQIQNIQERQQQQRRQQMQTNQNQQYQIQNENMSPNQPLISSKTPPNNSPPRIPTQSTNENINTNTNENGQAPSWVRRNSQQQEFEGQFTKMNLNIQDEIDENQNIENKENNNDNDNGNRKMTVTDDADMEELGGDNPPEMNVDITNENDSDQDDDEEEFNNTDNILDKGIENENDIQGTATTNNVNEEDSPEITEMP